MLRQTKTENGLVQGLPGIDARITVFKGIPFAAPPVGDLRWRAPQPAANWEGVRKCYEFGPIPMQPIPGKDPEAFYSKEWHVDPEVPMSEDCLQLNIWTNAKTGDEKMPVMMWIHGGGMQEGYAYEQEFDGERFAARGIVLVSVSYRLNVFGFLCHSDLTAAQPEDHANFGLMDCDYACQWIKRNIANFGGDPDNITIFGQSGGGAASQYLACSPKTVGHFQRAIFQSAGACQMVYPKTFSFMEPGTPTIEKAEAEGAKFLEYLGVKTIEEARKLDAKFIEEKQVSYRAETGKFSFPAVDGVFCVKDPGEAMIDDEMNDISVMVTATGDEFMGMPAPDENVIDWINDKFGDHAAEYLRLVKNAAGSDDPVDLAKAAKYSTFNLANRLSAEIIANNKHDVYFSVFDPYIPGDDAGSFHSCDLWFEFESLQRCWRPFDGHHYDLARKMCNYFANFARTGNPNGKDADGTDMPFWPVYTNENPHAMMLCDEVYVEKDTDPRMRMMLDVNFEKLNITKK